ncbi:MAG: type IV pilus biogenesis/stability protein PilW [Pseudomonadota bacterium]
MKKSGRQFIIASGFLLLAGCISTTTGPAEVEPDPVAAAQLNYELGARYYQNGSYDLARDRLLYSLEIDPKNATAHSVLALTYEQLDNIRLATESYESAVRVAPRNYDILNTYAVFLCRQGQPDEGVKYFERAVNATENDDEEITLTNAGTCMLNKPDLAAAETYFRRALEYKATYGDALINMALLKNRAEEYMSARAFFQRYLASNLPAPEILYAACKNEVALGDERAKSEYANRILREYPQSRQARQVLESACQ